MEAIEGGSARRRKYRPDTIDKRNVGVDTAAALGLPGLRKILIVLEGHHFISSGCGFNDLKTDAVLQTEGGGDEDEWGGAVG